MMVWGSNSLEVRNLHFEATYLKESMNVVQTLIQVVIIIFHELVLKFFKLKFLFYRYLTFDFFKFFCSPKMKENSVIERQKCKDPERHDRFLISLVDFSLQIFP